ncbi:MAG: hypothetical protein HOI95_07055 [Chromatiales bacterium]|jgi:tetratricopeptide (TPR) repeat protein|nr:hypothetical protein [Chromatiales bacterium]
MIAYVLSLLSYKRYRLSPDVIEYTVQPYYRGSVTLRVPRARVQFQTFSRTGHREVEKFARTLFKSSPDSASANRWMGWVHWQKALLGISDNREENLEKALEFANEALGLDENAYTTYDLIFNVELLLREYASALSHAELALDLAPVGSNTTALAGGVKLSSGYPEEGVALLEKAMRYEPDYAQRIPDQLIYGLCMLKKYDQTVSVAEAMLAAAEEAKDFHAGAHRYLAAISIWQGDPDKARRHIQQYTHPTLGVGCSRQEWQDQVNANRHKYRAYGEPSVMRKYAASIGQRWIKGFSSGPPS